jgi:hypothetical protein
MFGMSMTTLVNAQDLLGVSKHLDEFSIWTETCSLGGDIRRVRITHGTDTAVGESVGVDDRAVVEFSSSNRVAVWAICARVGIPFTFV